MAARVIFVLLASCLLSLTGCAVDAAKLQGTSASFQDRHACADEAAAREAVARLRSEETLTAVRDFFQDTRLPPGGDTRVWVAEGSIAAGDAQRVSAHEFWEGDLDWRADVAICARAEGKRVTWEVVSHLVGFEPSQNALVADVLALRAYLILQRVAREGGD